MKIGHQERGTRRGRHDEFNMDEGECEMSVRDLSDEHLFL